MCVDHAFAYPIAGERLERLKARNDDVSPTYPEEWAQWIRQESPALRRFLKHRLRRRRDVEQDTEDALQWMWLNAYQKVGLQYDRPTLHRAYLFWLALAASSEVMRKGGREQLLGGNDRDDDDDFEPSVLAWLASRGIEDERALRQKLEELLDIAEPKLSDLERTIVLRRLFDGQTFAEIAADLALSLGTVATAYYRALGKLRRGLLDLG